MSTNTTAQGETPPPPPRPDTPSVFNLNADMGEGFGAWRMGADGALLGVIQSANIACGFHAGDYAIMAEVMGLAKDKGVSIGAHPGFYDLHGFGRRPLHLPHNEIAQLIAYQLGASLGVAALVGARVSHIKPHGALNNMACVDLGLATAIVAAIKAVDEGQILLAPFGSQLVAAGRDAGLLVAAEFFADRTYQPDATLTPRNRPQSLITDADIAADNCLKMLGEGRITALDGTEITARCQSICVHGDGATALTMAQTIRNRLTEAGFTPATLPEIFKGFQA